MVVSKWATICSVYLRNLTGSLFLILEYIEGNFVFPNGCWWVEYFLYPLPIQKRESSFSLSPPPPSSPSSHLLSSLPPFLSPSHLKEMVWKDKVSEFLPVYYKIFPLRMPIHMSTHPVLKQIFFLWHSSRVHLFLSSNSTKTPCRK